MGKTQLPGKLRDFFDLSSEIFVLLDSSLSIEEINRKGLDFFGIDHKNIIGRSLFDVLQFSMGARARIIPSKVRRAILRGEFSITSAFPVLVPKGKRFVKVRSFRSGDKRGLIITDVTEGKGLKLGLRKKEERYRLLAENMREGIALINRDGIVEYINKKFLDAHGLEHAEVEGHDIARILDEDSAQLLSSQLSGMERGKIASLKLTLRDMGSRRFDTHVALKPITNKKGLPRGAILVIQDITEQKRAEEELQRSREELRNLYQHLHRIREEESTRIAREIHDELGQTLTALKMDVSWLQSRGDDTDQGVIFEKIRAMSRLIDSTIETVQKISSELRPGLLDDLGLSAALEWQAQEFQNRTGITCAVLFGDSNFNLGADSATALFRIVQEALTNVARHAQATEVKIDLKESKDTFRLMILDNGRGISTEEIHSPKSLGIIGMRERLRPFRGRLRIKGTPQKGTKMTITIPKRRYS